MASQSKRFHVTLSVDEGSEIEQAAAERKVSPTQIIRERLQDWQQWQPRMSGSLGLEPSLQPVESRLDAVLALLPSIERRLQRLDEQYLTIQDSHAVLLSEGREAHYEIQLLRQQFLQEDVPDPQLDRPLFIRHTERLELYLQALLELLGQVSLDVAPPEEAAKQATDLQSVLTRLEEYLTARG